MFDQKTFSDLRTTKSENIHRDRMNDIKEHTAHGQTFVFIFLILILLLLFFIDNTYNKTNVYIINLNF